MELPDDLKELFAVAETELSEARAADATLEIAETNLDASQADAETAAADALVQHQEANGAATAFVDAIKVHFGL